MTTLRSFALALTVLTVGCKQNAAPAGARVIALKVTEEGFLPAEVKVKRGEPLLLKITRTTEKTCATEILIEGSPLDVPLPLNQTVDLAYTPSKSGEIRYGCAMGMMVSGVLIVD